jgi:pimeloyl-ACP methyl ester carboxylesterase
VLSYEVHGTGEPLVLVHGITHRRQAWYPVLEHLTPHRQVILIDLPGHGESPDLVTNGRSIPETLGAEVRETIESLGIRNPHIAGNSLGGRVALDAAAEGWVASATGLSPAGFWLNDIDFTYTRMLFRVVTRAARIAGPRRAEKITRTSLGRALFFSWITAHPARLSPEACAGDAKAMLRALPAMKAIVAEATRFEAKIAPEIPVTIAWASRDLVLPPYHARIARKVLPRATHIKLKGVGHVPMSDNPGLVARILLEASGGIALGETRKQAA